jgi:hypothetical protein
MRALSLYAGMTMLYLGYSANVPLLPFSMTLQWGKTQDMITPLPWCNADPGKKLQPEPRSGDGGRPIPHKNWFFLNSMWRMRLSCGTEARGHD